VVRANLSVVAGELKPAREFAQRAIREEPGLVPAYLSLLDVSVHGGNFEESLDLLKMLDQKFKIEFNELTSLPAYAGFVKSPQYQEWLKYLAQKAEHQKARPGKAPGAKK
jgi:hypothetical protein